MLACVGVLVKHNGIVGGYLTMNSIVFEMNYIGLSFVYIVRRPT